MATLLYWHTHNDAYVAQFTSAKNYWFVRAEEGNNHGDRLQHLGCTSGRSYGRGNPTTHPRCSKYKKWLGIQRKDYSLKKKAINGGDKRGLPLMWLSLVGEEKGRRPDMH